MNYNKFLIVMVGNIGSGKSTLVKRFAKQGYVVICRDSLRYAIGAGEYIFDIKLEPAIWKSEQAMLRNFMQMGVSIVVDEVGVTKRMRETYIEKAKEFGYKIGAIEMPRWDKEKSVERRMTNPHGTPRQTWYEVWEKFDKIYQSPTKEEGFDWVLKLERDLK